RTQRKTLDSGNLDAIGGVPSRMRMIGILFVGLYAWAADSDAIVRKALSSEISRQQKLGNYTWEEKSIEKMFDQKGKLQSTHSKVFENLIIDGSEYRRMIEDDGSPLDDSRAQKEQEKMDREIAKRHAESPEQRKERLDRQAKRRQESIRFREEVIEAFHFSIAGEEKMQGFDCWKIQAEPKPGYVAQSREGKLLLGKVRGTMWITKASSDLVKVDVETTQKLTFGGFLASLSPGAHIDIEMMRVNDELWYPRTIHVGLNARALLKHVNIEEELSYRNFRKFQAESKLVATTER
ncbi:MAG TPA: hypothetical protein VGL53_16315, partial [Bryobacteraceae bacterium]